MCSWFKKLADKLGAGQDRQDSRHVAKQPAARRRRATLGLDFGTSSSKCCFREEANRKPFYFAAFTGTRGSAATTLFPTVIDWANGAIRFGPAADLNGPAAVTSFKMCLLCQAQHDHGLKAAESCNRCLRSNPGRFDLDGEVVSAEDLCTLHVSVLLSEILPRLPKTLGIEADRIRVHLNAAGPLDQMSEFGAVGTYFERVMFYALRLAEAGVPRREWERRAALDALTQVRSEAMPQAKDSPTRVFPETHAACLGFMLLPECERGLYGLVDIGAGTTDVSFFWLQKDHEDTVAWYYAAGTKRLGMDDVDRSLAAGLSLRSVQLRQAREALSPSRLERLASRFRDVERGLYQHYFGVFSQAVSLDQRTEAWSDRRGVAQFQLFLAGGGACCAPLVKRFRQVPPRGTSWRNEPAVLCVPEESRVSMPGGAVSTLAEATTPPVPGLLLLAYGLAHPRADIPKHFRDYEGVARAVEPSRGFTPEELFGHT